MLEHFSCLRLLNTVVLVTAVTCLVTKASVVVPSNGGCTPCALDDCVNQTNCLGGSSMDECNCCSICLKVEGEPCGGLSYRLGRCDRHLYCNITGPYRRDPVGKCAPKATYQHISNQRQYIPTVVHINTGAQASTTHRYPSTNKTLQEPGTNNRAITSLGSNDTTRTKEVVIHKTPTKKGTLSSAPNNVSVSNTGSPSSNKAFLPGERKNKGINKDTEYILNSPVDTKPAILFLITSGIIIAFLVVMVTCFGEKFKRKRLRA
ncbi:uncharacterized protein LOC116305229 [Actinia tenebrosa]|uniref:Uncharacterized protein LOC116305229 n=1 Tax=Actinia tenebrosa TaxID=6105 RepID=A0A6P8IYS0_ACTTE|nr:uncharacterized protein LOC116305229 [Actinia tenebrosa]